MTQTLNSNNTVRHIVGIGFLCLALQGGCTTFSPSTTIEMSQEAAPIQEGESGQDSPMEGTGSGAPEDCIEQDTRPACHITPRAGFLPEKLKSERFTGRCLRPANGSTEENIEIILSTCENSKSRFWLQKRERFGKGFRLENLNSGKCIERMGDRLMQRTCAGFGPSAANQVWVFVNTHPFGSGDFLKPMTPQGGCLLAINPARVRVSSCQNDADRRWYQAAF